MKPYFDFTQETIRTRSNNNVDIAVSGEMNLNAFTGMTTSANFEVYKKQIEYKEKVVFMYFTKAVFAFQSCLKMYEILKQKDTIIGMRIDSDIITKNHFVHISMKHINLCMIH